MSESVKLDQEFGRSLLQGPVNVITKSTASYIAGHIAPTEEPTMDLANQLRYLDYQRRRATLLIDWRTLIPRIQQGLAIRALTPP